MKAHYGLLKSARNQQARKKVASMIKTFRKIGPIAPGMIKVPRRAINKIHREGAQGYADFVKKIYPR